MNIPAQIQSALRNPSTKKPWISEYPVIGAACTNCGGSGVVVAFIATEGPYDQPGGPYLVKNGVRLTSHSDTIKGQVKFWVGQTISLPCPECQNKMAPTSITPGHTWNGAKQLAAKMDVRDDYADK